MDTFLLFLLVGFLAQAVDGALGMAYGLTSNTVLLAFGVPPAAASASVHAAEVFTTAASGGSHIYHRNVTWSLWLPLTVGLCLALLRPMKGLLLAAQFRNNASEAKWDD